MLERHERKFFQTFPVIKVVAASNSGGECSLDTFQFLDVSDFVGLQRGEQYSRRLRTIDLYRFSITVAVGFRMKNTLKTQQAFCLALSHVDRMCVDQLRS